MFLLANGVLDAAAQETSLERFTGGIGIPIFSISLFAQIAGDCSSASGSATVVLSIESRGGVFGLLHANWNGVHGARDGGGRRRAVDRLY